MGGAPGVGRSREPPVQRGRGGVESYTDPAKSYPVELPSGYRNAWVSQSGEYVLSNEDGFDPNVGSTIGWQRMGTAK